MFCAVDQKAAGLTADAIERDRPIYVYGGGGHATPVMGVIQREGEVARVPSTLYTFFTSNIFEKTS